MASMPCRTAHTTVSDDPLAAQANTLERLRAAGLRPTMARIGVHQAVAAAGVDGVTAHDAFQSVLQRGIRISFSSVFRIMREFCEHGLLFSMAVARGKTALYFVRGGGPASAQVRFECAGTGECAVVEDAVLHARLLTAARQAGLDLEGLQLVVRG